MGNESGKTLLALVAGAAIGAVVGILFAPDKGELTRSKLKRNLEDKTNGLKNQIDELSNRIKGFTEMDLEAGFDELVANVDDKTAEVVERLERKLEELKAASAKLKR